MLDAEAKYDNRATAFGSRDEDIVGAVFPLHDVNREFSEKERLDDFMRFTRKKHGTKGERSNPASLKRRTIQSGAVASLKTLRR